MQSGECYLIVELRRMSLDRPTHSICNSIVAAFSVALQKAQASSSEEAHFSVLSELLADRKLQLPGIQLVSHPATSPHKLKPCPRVLWLRVPEP